MGHTGVPSLRGLVKSAGDHAITAGVVVAIAGGVALLIGTYVFDGVVQAGTVLVAELRGARRAVST